jgi:sigma-B regulation protein RsbU (phosphoserine phosphatase)
MTFAGRARFPLPESVRQSIDEFSTALDVDVSLWALGKPADERLYPDRDDPGLRPETEPVRRRVHPRDGSELELRVWRGGEAVADLVARSLERSLDAAHEIRFFTFELSERYEEINLLYSISETLGSILRLDDAARVILSEVCDVMGARRGSLWVHEPADGLLRLTASVGTDGIQGPLRAEESPAITARVFREARPMMASPDVQPGVEGADDERETFLSVPIRYSPPEGEARTVGVINLIGRSYAGRFTASDQKLLSAIATQVGAALENNRLIRQSLQRERLEREMELAHNLQQKLLPAVERFDGVRAAARVEPAERVGGDFYQLFHLSDDRVGVMIGDVSSHGFPAALIMALAMSAASIYASEFSVPAKVLNHVDEALRDELETTEMYLSLFYAVLDPRAGTLTWSNAGHPHAFLVGADGCFDRLAATDPPVGIAAGDYGEEVRPWDPEGDVVLLFTDGLSDALVTPACPQGERRVLDTVVGRRHEAPASIVEALFALVAEAPSDIPADDRTALVLTGSE